MRSKNEPDLNVLSNILSWLKVNATLIEGKQIISLLNSNLFTMGCEQSTTASKEIVSSPEKMSEDTKPGEHEVQVAGRNGS
jgi:hypothetical protein